MATSMGTVKKTTLDEFNNPRKGGIIAVNLDDGDYLIGAALTDGKHDVMLFSDGGKAVRFDEEDVRPLGRNARGVRGMSLDPGQGVIAMLVAEDEQQSVLTATENGYGKRTSITEYTRHGRGTKGMIAIQQSERNGKVVAATLVHADDEIMLITDKGVLVRTRVAEIRELGRATQGVTLIGLDEGAKLSGLQRIVENDANGEIDAGQQTILPHLQRRILSEKIQACTSDGRPGWQLDGRHGPGQGRAYQAVASTSSAPAVESHGTPAWSNNSVRPDRSKPVQRIPADPGARSREARSGSARRPTPKSRSTSRKPTRSCVTRPIQLAPDAPVAVAGAELQ
jgi:hypothetical protein